jgi:hypothetical protein
MLGNFAQIGVLIALLQVDGAPPPDLQDISPTFGPVGGGTTVTLNGADFQSGATVTFDGIAATNVAFVSSAMLTARTPSHPAFGPVDVTVTNPDGQSSTLAGAFTYRLPTPTIGGVTPNSGTVLGSRVVTLSGTNFSAGATVAFGGVPATAVTVVSAASIRATTPPAGSPGPVNATVTNPDGQVATRANAYTYTLLTITAISPNVSSVEGRTPFTLTGMNIVPDCSVFFDTTIAIDIDVVDSTTITGVTPPHSAGNVNLVLRPPSGAGSDTIVGGFSYHTPPSLISLDISSGPASGGTRVALTGANFALGATVSFGGQLATPVIFESSVRLTAVTPRHDPGTVNVVVTNPDGLGATLASSFTFGLAPRVDRVEPSSGAIAGGTLVTVRGANFRPGAAVQFGGTPSSVTSVINEDSLIAATPAHIAGAVDVSVINPDGQSATLVGGFSYGTVPPTLDGLTPGAGPLAGGTQVALSGSNFASGATVTFGGANATNVNVSSSTISATTPPHSSGAVDVVVTNPDGQSAAMPAGFVYRSDAASPTDEYIDPATVGPKGCQTTGSLTSIFGLTAALLWLTSRRRRASARQ